MDAMPLTVTRPQHGWLLLMAALSLGAGSATGNGVTFYADVAPILKERCIGCHAGERPKGRLGMETFQDLQAGGREGEPLVAGKPGESLLYLVVSGQKEPFMPPRKEGSLQAAEVETIRLWIAGGCKLGEKNARPRPYARPLRPVIYKRAPAVTAITYAPDGRRLYIGGYREVLVHDPDRLVSASEVQPGGEGTMPLARWVGEAERIHSLSVSADGALLLAAGGSPARFGELQVWDTATGRLIRFVRLGKDTLFSAVFSPDAEQILAAGTDRRLHLVRTRTGEVRFASEVHSDWILGVGFTGKDGSRLVSAGRDKTVKISAAKDGKFVRTLATLGGALTAVRTRPGNSHFLVAGESQAPVLFDGAALKEVRKLEGQPGTVLAATFTRDGRRLAVAGSMGEVRVYQADSGKRVARITGLEGWVYALAFRPGGERLAAAGYGGRVYVLDVAKQEVVQSFVPVPLNTGDIVRQGAF